MQRNSVSKLSIAALVISGLAQAQELPSSGANQPAVGKVSIPGSNYDLVFGAAEPSVDVRTNGSSHPAVVMLYLSDGEVWYLVDGQPVRTYKIGSASQTPESAFPQGRGGGNAPAMMAVYIVERNGPSGPAAVGSCQ